MDKLWIMGKTHVTLRYVNYFYQHNSLLDFGKLLEKDNYIKYKVFLKAVGDHAIFSV